MPERRRPPMPRVRRVRWTVGESAVGWIVGTGLAVVFVAFLVVSEDLALSLEFVGAVVAAGTSGAIAVACLTMSRATTRQILGGLAALALCLTMLGLLAWAVVSVL